MSLSYSTTTHNLADQTDNLLQTFAERLGYLTNHTRTSPPLRINAFLQLNPSQTAPLRFPYSTNRTEYMGIIVRWPSCH